MAKPILEIDGVNFSSLEEFYDEVGRKLIPGVSWGHNLDAFNDILRGDFGTPPGGFILVWQSSNLSRARLAYPETIRQLERRLDHCHLSNRAAVQAELAAARLANGPTVFDWLVETIHDDESVELRLE